ncbi:MAG: DUF2288 domain-containing protein [Methylococcales bacterium]|nr:DUF2288 domain-containing protein [Methylococcales bacterium]
MIDTNTDALNKDKVNLETSKIAWQELQRFFASGLAVFVASELDLVEVAHQFSIDNKDQVAEWMQNQQVGLVPDAQAVAWLESNADVWAVVVKPWILVQGC